MNSHQVLPYPMGMLPSRRLSRDGLGAIGPLGNASTIAGGDYKVTGTGVNFRDVNLRPTGNVLNIGDDFRADGGVKGTEANGVYTNFASGTSRLGSGYVAIEYLAPSQGFTPASYQPQNGGGGGGSGGAIQEISKTTTTTTTTVEKSFFEDNWLYFLGALAVGGIAYALFGTRKGKAVRRLARAKARKYRHRRRGKR